MYLRREDRWSAGSRRANTSRSYRAESAREAAKRCWVPPGESATLGNTSIGGMLYVGTGLEAELGGHAENCLVDPSLPVASRIVRDATDAGFAPRYDEISPSDRLGYLRWLASGRSDPNVAPPFLRLYFFGLERRLVVDEPSDSERDAIIAEVRRLDRLYGEEYGLDEELDELLEFVLALQPGTVAPEPLAMLDHEGPDLPLPLAASLGHRVAAGAPISGKWLLCWWLAQVEKPLRAAELRVLEEFVELFEMQFHKRYPDGLIVDGGTSGYDVRYEAASGTFVRQLRPDGDLLPDVDRLRRPARIAESIADECWHALDPYCRMLTRQPFKKGSVEAQLQLPADLAISFPNEGLKAMHAWAEEQVLAPNARASVRDVLRFYEGRPPKGLRKPRLVAAANALALGGYGLAPDPRFKKRPPHLGQSVALFRLPAKVAEPADMSEHYAPTLLILKLVLFAAQAAGAVSEAKMRLVEGLIDRRSCLEPADRLRLRADLRWMTGQKIGPLSIRRPCKALARQELDEVCEAAVKIACADKPVDPRSVEAVQRLYRSMGRSPDTVFASLHRGTAKLDSGRMPAPQQPASPRLAFRAARRVQHATSPASGGLDLDPERISAVVEDTRAVSTVLSEVFAEDEQEQAAAATNGSKPQAVYAGLDSTHCALVQELLDRPQWSVSEFEALAKRLGLLAGGALEAVNEWSFERFGDVLLEEDDEFTINLDVFQELHEELGT